MPIATDKKDRDRALRFYLKSPTDIQQEWIDSGVVAPGEVIDEDVVSLAEQFAAAREEAETPLKRDLEAARKTVKEYADEIHRLVNRHLHAASSLQVVARYLGIEHPDTTVSGWANVIWQTVKDNQVALRDAMSTLKAAP